MIVPELAEHFRVDHVEVSDFAIFSQSLLILSYIVKFA